MVKWAAVFILVLMPTAAWADERVPGNERVRIGAQISLGANSVGGPGTKDEAISYSWKPGFSAGAVARLRALSFLAAQVELAFATRGTDYNIVTMGDGSLSMTYIEMPVLLQVSLPSSRALVPHLLLGPSFGLRLDAKNVMPNGRVIDISNRVERMNVGLLLGLGTSVRLWGADTLLFDIRYYQGLRNFNEIAASEEDELIHEVLSFNVGYQTTLRIFGGGE